MQTETCCLYKEGWSDGKRTRAEKGRLPNEVARGREMGHGVSERLNSRGDSPHAMVPGEGVKWKIWDSRSRASSRAATSYYALRADNMCSLNLASHSVILSTKMLSKS